MPTTSTTAAAPVLTLTDVTREYRGRRVLGPLSIRVAPGEIVGLLGPNGAGKTTLLSIAAGILAPTSGRLVVRDAPVTSTAAAREARRAIGFLPQTPEWVPGFTGTEMVEYAGWLKGLKGPTLRQRARTTIEQVGMADEASRRMATMSGGMRQRVALAMALVDDPAILLLDEPTVGLDPAQRLAFREILSGLDTTAVVLSTHLVEDVRAVADRVLVLDHGRRVWEGTVAALETQVPEEGSATATRLERAYITLMREHDAADPVG